MTDRMRLQQPRRKTTR